MSKNAILYFLKVLLIVLFFMVIIFGLEYSLRSQLFQNINKYTTRIVLFSLAYVLFIVFVIGFFPKKIGKILIIVFLTMIVFIYFHQEIYHKCLGGFFSVTAFKEAGAGADFIEFYTKNIRPIHYIYLGGIILLILLFIFLDFEIVNIEYTHPLQGLMIGLVAIGTFVYASSTLTTDESQGGTSDRTLYETLYSYDNAVYKMGVLTYQIQDIKSTVLFNSSSLIYTDEEVDAYICENDKNSVNEMTGIFEDKNLIIITAESLDTYGIDEDITPTLYKMKTQGWYYDNFYSPLYYRSTGDAGLMLETSYYPTNGVSLSMEAYIDNTFPYTYPSMFSPIGYTATAYHNYNDRYYPRKTFYPDTLGYDDYKGAQDLGLFEDVEGENAFHVYPSDIDLMKNSIPYFIEDDKFMVSYITVSGHMFYNEQHPAVVKNKETVIDILGEDAESIDNSMINYLSTQYELDQAMEYLIDELESHNKLDDTVILILGDHYPYALDWNTITDYDPNKLDHSGYDIYNTPFIIYNPSLDGEVQHNYMSTIDIMPTIANMFGLGINNSLLMGNDVYTKIDNTISFVKTDVLTEKFLYDSITDSYTIYDDSITQEKMYYIHEQDIKKKIINKYILKTDYFKD